MDQPVAAEVVIFMALAVFAVRGRVQREAKLSMERIKDCWRRDALVNGVRRASFADLLWVVRDFEAEHHAPAPD